MSARRAEALRAAVSRLASAGVEDPVGDARRLLRAAAGLDAAALSARIGDAMPADEAARFEAALARRAAREPVAHILGLREFWGRSFRVTSDVLDPRPETETLIAAALEGGAAARILDLGVGSGCILLTLLAEWPAAGGTGVDASEAALAVARENAAALGVAARATLRPGDWLEDVSGPFDLIVSNPPYLASSEMADVAPELRREPAAALDGGPDGLAAYRRIAAGAARALAPGGRLLLEIGPSQAEPVSALLREAGLGPVQLRRDLDERPRVLGVFGRGQVD